MFVDVNAGVTKINTVFFKDNVFITNIVYSESLRFKKTF